MANKQDIPVIIHNGKRGLLTLEDGRLDVLQLSADGRPPKHLLSCPVRLLLRAQLSPEPPSAGANGPKRMLDIHALVQKSANSNHLRYTKIRVLVEPAHSVDAEQWVDQLMAAAYPVTKPYRNVLLLINPVSGKGKGVAIANHTIIPTLEAAGCKVDVRQTEYRNHAEEICRDADLSMVDVIAVASGDGGCYEAFNGLAMRPDGRKALRIPLAPLPTGSACAACTNLFGPKNTFNVLLATLNVIKGQPMPIDLQSVVLLPSLERRVSFLSVALGLMVDLDIGTENLRWIGDSRFLYGYLRGIMQNKSCKARIQLNIVDDDKEKMAREAVEAAAADRGPKTVGGGTDPLQLIRGVQTMSVASQAVANGDGYGDGLTPSGSRKSSGLSAKPIGSLMPADAASPAPVNGAVNDDERLPLADLLEPTEAWVTVDSSGSARHDPQSATQNAWSEGEAMLFLYSGLMPYVARDLNQWPVIRAGSGVIDIVLQRCAARSVMLGQATEGASGRPYWLSSQCYYKVLGYTVENLDKKGQPKLTIDGEGYDWDSFHVEVLPRAATLLALDGHYYQAEFLLQAPGAAATKPDK
ncbi:hypothetical protein CcaverHIS002_0308260 [Cutaneotrichosporon cavernicola]|uniref:DAGKc domain-containing protein n=1 Tax=Cutaneotrichosporon cavernicola TaxID=279322 RepID=A0AA48I3U7_9TREE|nr:uncharacterized protein CcaverHIS019_0308140 [Cutaneotrichosporon cavernicola]BEI82958.1 hypothetical protein CcaverHIS002_0308260 [Cutaneotrichosporon cavernicola]BEI90744.1 hypothetical protein CcaverHIS019_0308140 [Cutaneotrichosporon cavernicola]BEI98524.1 hypothetical protein CcaverHIS631_0308230 [Cutaneotrichosporon cavernicola]BEJ06295.1 hypothetical protein CcaverHIS641_0308170 [Cutaneotrichosporon cavernicola]